MKIESLGELKKLIRMCREEGVNKIVVDGVDITIEGRPRDKASTPSTREVPGDLTFDPGKIDTPDFPTEEQLLFGSSDPTVWQKDQQ